MGLNFDKMETGEKPPRNFHGYFIFLGGEIGSGRVWVPCKAEGLDREQESYTIVIILSLVAIFYLYRYMPPYIYEKLICANLLIEMLCNSNSTPSTMPIKFSLSFPTISATWLLQFIFSLRPLLLWALMGNKLGQAGILVTSLSKFKIFSLQPSHHFSLLSYTFLEFW